MNDPKRNVRDEIDDCLNELLDTEHADQATMPRDPAEQRRLDQLKAVDRLLFTEYGEFASRPAQPMPAAARPHRSLLLAAAAMVLLGVAVWVSFPPTPAPSVYGQRFVAVANLYTSTLNDFVPDIVCDTPEKFADYTDDAFGIALTARFDTAAVLVGWKSDLYGQAAEGKAPPGPRVLLATAPTGQPVVVLFTPFVDASITDRKTKDGVELSVHSDRIGGIAVHEISTLPEPVILGLLSRDR